MKRILACLLFVFSLHLLVALTAYADPRMETNKNFCHFILEAVNTDHEVFLAGCDSTITVAIVTPTAGSPEVQCEDQNRVASGYAAATKVMPAAAAPLPAGTLTITSNDCDTPCTMVESNGRAYRSTSWQSVITVTAIAAATPATPNTPNPRRIRPTTAAVADAPAMVTVQYELSCTDGHQ